MAKLNEIRQAAQQMQLRQQPQQQQPQQLQHQQRQNSQQFKREMEQNPSSSVTTSGEYDLQVDHGGYRTNV